VSLVKKKNVIRESRTFCGRKSIDRFACTVKLFQILKVKNALILRQGVKRLQACFNFDVHVSAHR